MRPFHRLFEVVTGSSYDYFFLKRDIFVENIAERKNFRLRLIIYKGKHIDRKSRLHCRLCEKFIEDNLRVRVFLYLDDDTHTVSVRFVAQVGNSLKAFFSDLGRDIRDKLAFVYLIGKFGDDYPRSVFAEIFEFGARPYGYMSSARSISGSYPSSSHYYAFCREVGSVDVFKQFVEGRFGVIEDGYRRVDDFRKVVRRDIRRHTYGNTRRTVYQKVRETARQNSRFFARFVEVRVPVNGIFFDIAEHFVRNFRHSRFRVTVSRGRVAVDRTEVSVTFEQRISHRKVLRKSYKSVVNRCVSVRVIPTENVAYRRRAFSERLVGSQSVLVHRV